MGLRAGFFFFAGAEPRVPARLDAGGSFSSISATSLMTSHSVIHDSFVAPFSRRAGARRENGFERLGATGAE
ncbi:hypothetical protein XI08_25495 [Bradyrhizobium sp. CCBAU 11361]|nr:hypothetical protein [Bradyrhizobium sp. CCBAU 11361]